MSSLLARCGFNVSSTRRVRNSLYSAINSQASGRGRNDSVNSHKVELSPNGSLINDSAEVAPRPAPEETSEERASASWHETVRLEALGKEFPPADSKAAPLRAVDGMQLSFYEGQIMALLGHNGAVSFAVVLSQCAVLAGLRARPRVSRC